MRGAASHSAFTTVSMFAASTARSSDTAAGTEIAARRGTT